MPIIHPAPEGARCFGICAPGSRKRIRIVSDPGSREQESIVQLTAENSVCIYMYAKE
jgi:hypothetical protein